MICSRSSTSMPIIIEWLARAKISKIHPMDVEAERERKRLVAARFRAANPDKVKARAAAYYAANRDKERARCALYGKTHAPRRRPASYYRDWRAKNPDKARAIVAAYAERNKEEKRVRVRNRRARKRQAQGRHTAGEIKALVKRQKNRCANSACRASLKDGYHADHIVALVSGGSDWITNIQLLCPPCNQGKGAKHHLDWSRQNGLLL